MRYRIVGKHVLTLTSMWNCFNKYRILISSIRSNKHQFMRPYFAIWLLPISTYCVHLQVILDLSMYPTFSQSISHFYLKSPVYSPNDDAFRSCYHQWATWRSQSHSQLWLVRGQWVVGPCTSASPVARPRTPLHRTDPTRHSSAKPYRYLSFTVFCSLWSFKMGF